ncbi:MAG TPA: hypothetical protein VFE06_16870 [Acidobacteriaceae bacterium]|nr:hypothetical protein [Acidobacteriaceae bacterium]
MPEPTAEPTAALPNETEKRDRCRAITTDGHRCKNGATYNGHLCWPHAHHRHPVMPDPTHVAIPLLEDLASVQLVLSQITHGLFTYKLDTDRARAMIYACQVASSTMPRPPRLPSPGTDPNQDSADGKSDTVCHLALDYEGLICGDGALPAPSAHWRPASPEATPWDLIEAAPNQSKPTPRSPADPDTHENCAICDEIRKMQGQSYLHPHLQPTVNPYCKWNQSGCQGPASDSRCRACESVYNYDPARYDRRRRRHSERSEEPRGPQTGPEREDRVPHPSRPLSGARGWEAENPSQPKSRVNDIAADNEEPEPQPLPNPLPDQFPDNDPMLNGYIPIEAPDDSSTTLDLKAAAEPATLYSAPCTPYPAFRGNTQKLLPSNPFQMNKRIPLPTQGVPHGRLQPTTNVILSDS